MEWKGREPGTDIRARTKGVWRREIHSICRTMLGNLLQEVYQQRSDITIRSVQGWETLSEALVVFVSMILLVHEVGNKGLLINMEFAEVKWMI